MEIILIGLIVSILAGFYLLKEKCYGHTSKKKKEEKEEDDDEEKEEEEEEENEEEEEEEAEEDEKTKRNDLTLPIRFIEDKFKLGAYTVTGGKCVWNKKCGDWAVLDKEMKPGAGTYAMGVELVRNGQLMIGVVSKTSLLGADRFGPLGLASGHCAIGYSDKWDFMSMGKYNSLYNGKKGSIFPPSKKNSLRLVLDTNARVLYFFLNGKQIPHFITNIPLPSYFVMCASRKGVKFCVTSLTKLLTPPPVDETLECSVYEWQG